MVNANISSKILMVLYLFLVIFNPPLFKNFSFTIILSLFAGVYLLINWKRTQLVAQKCMLNKLIPIFVFSAYYILLIVLINSMFNSDISFSSYLSTFTNYVFYYGVLIVVILFINLVSEKKHLTFEDLLICFIWAGGLQVSITILSYLFPPVRELTLQLIINNSSSEKIARTVQYTKSIRNYGLASSLYDIFGYSTAILVSISFVYGLFKKHFYVWLSFLLLAMPLFNARTGLVLSIVGIIIALLFYLKPKSISDIANKFLVLATSITGVILIFYFINTRILMDGSSSSVWIMSGINDVISFISGKSESGYFSTVINDFIFFPTLLKTIFGAGATPMILIGENTDVGYIYNIWQFGIIGSVIIYYMNYKIFKLSYKNSRNPMNKAIVSFLLVMFFIYMIKLNSLGYSQASVITFPLLFKIIHDRNTETEIE